MPVICQINWYTLGNDLESCLFKSKCYTDIYSSKCELLKNQSFYPSLPEFFLDPHCSLWQKTGVAISHSYPSYQHPRAFSSKWFTLNLFFTFSASLFLPCLEIQQYKKKSKMGRRNKQFKVAQSVLNFVLY